MNNKAFRWRAFISFLLLFSFLLSAGSGIVLFLRPEGSLAAWTGWSALGLDKKGWEGLHAAAIFFFLLCAGIHLAYNWRALLAYCRRRGDTAQGAGRRREFLAALLLSGLVLAASLDRWFPVGWIVELRAMFKGGLAVVEVAPPLADADRLTMAELCPALGVGGEELLKAARRKRLRVESLSQTLAEVAKLNGSTPEKIFILLKAR